MPKDNKHPCFTCDYAGLAVLATITERIVKASICKLDGECRIVSHSCSEHTNKGEALAALQRKFKE